MDTQIKASQNGSNGNKNNQASITGRIGSIEDGDFHYATSEATGVTTPVFNLDVALNPPKQEGTTRVPQTQWFKAAILGPLAEAMANVLQTGMLVTLSGHASYRSWPALKDGEPITYTDEKSSETKPAYQTAANLVVDAITYHASDGLYYQASEKFGEVAYAVVAPPDSIQKANIVLRGTAQNIQMTKATETSQARLNFSVSEQYTNFSGTPATRRHKVTMWGDQAILAHAEMQEGDRITVLGQFSPNSYTDRQGIFQQGFNITARVLDNHGQKQQAAKVAAPQAEQPALAVTAQPAPKARAAKTSQALAQV